MTEEIKKTVETLKKGGIILYPTDTVWGIGCDATDREAVEKIFGIKKRNDSKSLIILAADIQMLEDYVKEVPEMAYNLIEVNDSPMTIIYPEAKGIADNAVAEDGSVGIRIPDNEFCRRMIRMFGKPVISTSANISGQPTPKCFSEIPEAIKESVDFIVDRSLEKGSTGKASSIIKLGLTGEIKIIRG